MSDATLSERACDSIIVIGSEEGSTYKHDGDGQIRRHDDKELVEVRVSVGEGGRAVYGISTRVADTSGMLVALADEEVIVSGRIKSIAHSDETVIFAVVPPEDGFRKAISEEQIILIDR